MKKLKTTLLALLLVSSQWVIGQSGSNCPDAIPQTVQAPTLAMMDTLSFDGVGSELWLEFQAPTDGSGVLIDYRMKPGFGGTDVIAIEVYQQIGSCANLQLIASKSLANDGNVLIQTSNFEEGATCLIKLFKDSLDTRNNDVVGNILKNGDPYMCWHNQTTGATGMCEYVPYNTVGGVPCVIQACPNDVICFDGFIANDQTIGGVTCHPLTGSVITNVDAWWWVPGTVEASLTGNNQPNTSTTGFGEMCFTYSAIGLHPVWYDIVPFTTLLKLNPFLVNVVEGQADASFTLSNYIICLNQGQPITANNSTFILFSGTQNTSNLVTVSNGANSWGPMTIANFNQNFTFPSAGTYTITVTAGVNSSCQTSDTQTQTVVVSNPVELEATYLCTEVTITNTGCYNPTGSNFYSWDMGNGDLISTPGNQVTYTYAQSGNYTVTMYLNNFPTPVTIPITIVDPISAPVIDSEFLTKCCTNGALYEVDNNYVSYTWDVGAFGTITSGQSTNSISVQWGAQGPGSFVNLTVVDANGCEAISQLWVEECCKNTFPIGGNAVFETNHCFPTLLSTFINTVVNSPSFTGTYVGFIAPNTPPVLTTTDALVINSNLIVDIDFDFVNCPNIYVRPDAKIIVDPNVNLKISTNSRLRPLCDAPWDGIYVSQSTSKVTIDKGSYVIGAYNAVYSENGGEYVIVNSFLLNNETGVRVLNSPNPNPSTIYSTIISTVNTFPNIPNVFPTRGKYGMYIQNVQNLSVGVPFLVAGSNVNTFNDLDFGIYINSANVTVLRNNFNNITLLSGGVLYQQGVAVYDELRKGLPETNLVVSNSQQNKNNFDNCHVGVYTLGKINLLARQNVMTNINYAGVVTRDNLDVDVAILNNNIKLTPGLSLGIYLWGPTAINASILNNSINLGAVPFGATYVAGIVVNQISTGSSNLIVIKNNTVRQCQFGIYSNNAPNIMIEGNTVQYQDNAGFTGNVYGVFATGSSFGQIINNTVTRIGGAPTNANQKLNFVGIHAENSPNVLIFKNTSNFFGKGIQAKGNNNQSTMQCNTLKSSFNGVFLESAFTGNQGIPSAPQDNKWVANVENKISGSASNTGAIWYHRNNGVYDINPYSQPLSSVNATITNSINFSCLNGPIGPGGGLGPKSLLRPIIFDPIVYDTKTFMGFDSTMRFIDQLYTRINFAQDTTWLIVGAPNDADYINYYAATQQTNLGKFCTIAKSYETNDTSALRSANTTLNTSVCHFSKGLQDVNQVFLDTWAAENYELTTQQTQLMEDLACSDALVNGPAVYGARAILGVFFECSNGYQKSAVVTSEPTEQEGTALKEDVVLLVYPNPSQGEVFLNYFLGERTEATILVYDISGKLLQSIPVATHQGIIQINNPFYQAGAYIYHVVSKGEMLGTGKFIIE